MSRAETAAKRFFARIEPGSIWDYSDHKAKPLVLAAFELYERSWAPFDIRQWEWPFATLDRGEPFVGDEPWTVLFRRAIEICHGSTS